MSFGVRFRVVLKSQDEFFAQQFCSEMKGQENIFLLCHVCCVLFSATNMFFINQFAHQHIVKVQHKK